MAATMQSGPRMATGASLQVGEPLCNTGGLQLAPHALQAGLTSHGARLPAEERDKLVSWPPRGAPRNRQLPTLQSLQIGLRRERRWPTSRTNV